MEIVEIKDSGNLLKERVVLRATQDCDLGAYILGISRILDNNGFSAKLQEIYWFPDKAIKEKDLVVLYTKHGENRSNPNPDGTTTHFFYWGLDAPLTEINNTPCAVLLNASWKTKAIPIPEDKTQEQQ